MERSQNKGDKGDVFEPGAGRVLGPGPLFDPVHGTYPNTDGYRNGKIVHTDIYIKNVYRAAGDDLTFDIAINGEPVLTGPTTSPSNSPTSSPTTKKEHVIEITIKTDDWPGETSVRTFSGHIDLCLEAYVCTLS